MLYFCINEVAGQQGLSKAQLHIKSQVAPSRLRWYWYNMTNHISLPELSQMAKALGVEPGSLMKDGGEPPLPTTADGKTIFDVMNPESKHYITYGGSGGYTNAVIVREEKQGEQRMLVVTTGGGYEQTFFARQVESLSTQEQGVEVTYYFGFDGNEKTVEMKHPESSSNRFYRYKTIISFD